MILLINLLIAIMSDMYALMSEVRTGLFWGSVINEMPKLQYSSAYGALNIFPFFFAWLSFLAMPFLVCIKNRDTLKTINNALCYIVYFPLSVLVLAVFMAVNALLIPFAYLKTVYHKMLLLKRYRSQSHCKNLLTFTLLGVPFLIIAQFTDAVRFMRHSYSSDQRQQIDRYYKLSISLSEFRKLFNNVNVHIEEGFEEMNAIEFVNLLREEH